MNRRQALQAAALATGTAAASARPLQDSREAARDELDARLDAYTGDAERPLPIRLACKLYMVQGELSLADKLKRVRDVGYDGIELDSPNSFERDEVLAARDASGLRIHGVVDSTHWQVRHSSPDPAVRAQAVRDLETAIRDSHAYGGTSVLLVPGTGSNAASENAEHVWERSIDGIRQVLPLAAELGIHVLIENVWNHFGYVHDGPPTQTAHALAGYLDAIGSPWVGSYFDIGNHRKYGRPEQWLRTLGPRVVKLDVKDWGFENGWSRIGEGSVDWPAVCDALRAIRYTGWATAEVGGGDEAHLADVLARMRRVFELA